MAEAGRLYERYTVGFFSCARPGTVLGSVLVEMTDDQITDGAFLSAQLADQLRRRGPTGAKAALYRGELSDGEICVAGAGQAIALYPMEAEPAQ